MFPSAQNGSQSQQNVDCQKHCILVAASNPHPLSTPVFRPQMQNLEQSENIDAQIENRLSDAEAIAKSFALVFNVHFSLPVVIFSLGLDANSCGFIFSMQCAVSLSVICPKQLPKLRAIFNAVMMTILTQFFTFSCLFFLSFPY